MMLEEWQRIAKKLQISEDECVLLHAFNRGWLGNWGKRRCYIVVSGIVERFGLDDRDYDKTYAQQLFVRGILDESEAALFTGAKTNAETQKADSSATPTVERIEGAADAADSGATADPAGGS
jgi:hypothetical protein